MKIWGGRAGVTMWICQFLLMWIRLLEEAGHVDILCNNAGMQFRKNAFDYPEEMFDKVIAVNLKAPYRLSQKAAIHFRDKGIKGYSAR